MPFCNLPPGFPIPEAQEDHLEAFTADKRLAHVSFEEHRWQYLSGFKYHIPGLASTATPALTLTPGPTPAPTSANLSQVTTPTAIPVSQTTTPTSLATDALTHRISALGAPAFITALRQATGLRSDVSVECTIGVGYRGQVVKVKSADKLLAVKVFGFDRQVLKTSYINVLQKMRADLAHDPHLIDIVEVVSTAHNELVVAMEFAPHGNLLQKMLKPEFQVLDRIKALVGIAESALVLHGRLASAHGNLKPTNVLFSANDTVQLSDYCPEKLASSCYDTYQMFLRPKHYTDPESVVKGPLTPKSDVYSLGVIATELLTGKTAPDIPALEELKKAMTSFSKSDITALLDRRCTWSDMVVSTLVKLILRCRAWCSYKRPEMAQVHSTLLELQHTLEEEERAKKEVPPANHATAAAQCPICLQHPPAKAAVPCGHMFCAACVAELQEEHRDTTCALCRQAVTNYLKVFLS